MSLSSFPLFLVQKLVRPNPSKSPWLISSVGRLLPRALALFCGIVCGASSAHALTATPSTTEGPYYTLSTDNNVSTPGNSLYDGHFYTTEGADNDLTHITSASSQCTGSIYLLSGHLYNTSGTAIAGAVIEIWEADNNGIYWYNSSSSSTNNYSGRDQLFQGYGRCVTDSGGNWNFRTVKPGLYTGRIRHFHLRVNVNGALLLTTQYMFSEDSGSFSSDSVAAPLVSAGTMSLVTLTTTSGTDSSGNSVLIGAKDLVVSYTGTVSGAPTVTTDPISVAATSGGSATFTVAATGTGTLSYQWYKGKSVASGGTAVSGATSASYTISSVSSSNVGDYYAVVTNTVGTATASVESNAAALTVSGASTSGAPTITTQPSSVTASTGSSATFSVVATSATSYQWYKGTVGSGTAISGATSSSYTISSVTSSSAGTYYVVVTNSYGSTTSSGATLTVGTSGGGGGSTLAITTQPTSQTVTAGGSATFSVVATSPASITYQWYFGGTAISGATSSSYTISSVTSSNAGSYYVIVKDVRNSLTSSTATLTVNAAGSAPSVTTQPTSVSVLAGNSASFTMAASSTTAMTYQWYKGSVGSGTAISGATAATYTINTVASTDAGTYYAKVTNTIGSTSTGTATLTVTEPYTAFLSAYGLTATTGSATSDPDSDSVPNALEFLLGGSPVTPDSSVLPTSSYQLVNGATALVFVFNLALPVGGTTWTVEYSADTVNWTTAVAGTGGVTMSMGSTAATTSAGRTVYPVTVVIPTSATQVYARLRVNPAL